MWIAGTPGSCSRQSVGYGLGGSAQPTTPTAGPVSEAYKAHSRAGQCPGLCPHGVTRPSSYAGGVLNVGGGEVLVVLVVALIFLGPERLPQIARHVGKGLAEFRRITAGVHRDLRDAMDAEGVRESLDTLRELANVRNSLVNDFSATARRFTSTSSPGVVAEGVEPNPSPLDDATVPPPHGQSYGPDPTVDPVAGTAFASPASVPFYDVLSDREPPTRPGGV